MQSKIVMLSNNPKEYKFKQFKNSKSSSNPKEYTLSKFKLSDRVHVQPIR